jgi:hypothetical protein
VEVERSFSNVAAADLSLAVLEGKVSTASEAAAWMNQRGLEDPGVSASASRGSVRSAQ